MKKDIGRVWEWLHDVELNLDGRYLRVIEDKLCCKCWKNKLGPELSEYSDDEKGGWTEAWVVIDISLTAFVKLVERIPDEEYFLLGANFALTQHNRRHYNAERG